jgi:uncharacterized membrane protein (DUF2068 family)
LSHHINQIQNYRGIAALFLTDETGLLFRKRWAEWLTIVATNSLMPIEVYELVKKFTAVRQVRSKKFLPS